MDRGSGRSITVSTWDTEDHAGWSPTDVLGDIVNKLQSLNIQTDPPEIFEAATADTLRDGYLRVHLVAHRSRQGEEASKVDVASAGKRMPGCESYFVATGRAAGRAVSVSTWDTQEHAKFPLDAGEIAQARSRLEAMGLHVDSVEVYETIPR